MNKYGPKAQDIVAETMHEYKRAKLKSGTSGKKVKDKNQALAIGIAKARKSGAKTSVRKYNN